MEELLESSINVEPVANVEPQEQASESVNSEVAPLHDKPVQSAEDNAKFAAIRRQAETEAKQKAKDETIAELYGETHGIYTYADYQKALQAQKEQEELESLISSNVPEQYAKEMLENKKFREQYQAQQKTVAEQERRNNDYKAFIDEYPDVKPESIPAEVWAEAEKKSLVDAYARYENKQLRQQISQVKKNEENIQATTGSVTGNGDTHNVTLTPEMVEKMSPQEIAKRWQEVKKVFNMK
jgi:hypothetical protein